MNPRRRHRLLVPIRLLISIAAVVLIIKFLLLPALHKNKTNFSNLVHINVGYLVLGVGLEVVSLFAYAKLTQSLLPGKPLRFFTILRVDLSTFALSHLVPGGTVAGTALGYRLLDTQGISYTDATFALGTQGIGSAVVLNIIFWAALIVSIPLHGVSHNLAYLYRSAALVGALLLTLSGALIFFLTVGQERASRVIRRIATRVPFLDAERFERALRQLAEHLASLARDRRLLLRALTWATANWAADAASLWVFLLAFGHTVLPPYLLVAYGLAFVLAAIPITPSGLGVVETVLIGILQGFGIANAALGVLSYRVVNFLLPIPVGGAAYLSLTVHKAVADSRTAAGRGGRLHRLGGLRGEITEELRGAVHIARTEAEHLDEWARRFGVTAPHRRHDETPERAGDSLDGDLSGDTPAQDAGGSGSPTS